MLCHISIKAPVSPALTQVQQLRELQNRDAAVQLPQGAYKERAEGVGMNKEGKDELRLDTAGEVELSRYSGERRGDHGGGDHRDCCPFTRL